MNTPRGKGPESRSWISLQSPRQQAIIKAHEAQPDLTGAELARLAGCSENYAGLVVRESRLVAAGKSSPAPIAGTYRTATNPALTVKQAAVQSALDKHPRGNKETVMEYCRRIAGIAKVSWALVHARLQILKYEQLGEQLRAQEAAEAATRCQVIPAGINIGPVTNFQGWPDFFGRIKVLCDAYNNLALQRGDCFASSFIREIHSMADRAQSRAAMKPTGY